MLVIPTLRRQSRELRVQQQDPVSKTKTNTQTKTLIILYALDMWSLLNINYALS
jgi:hypothetical protein